MSKKVRRCAICGGELPRGELGFNPEPYKPCTSGTCCIKCYHDKVLPLRNKKCSPQMIAEASCEGDIEECRGACYK